MNKLTIPARTHCALCGAGNKLVNSHIFPQFLFQPMLNPKRQIPELDREKGITKWRQSGPKEKLLCSGCDNAQVGAWEKYFSENWPFLNEEKWPGTESLWLLQDLDYPKTLLFLQSLIWRAAVSQGPLGNLELNGFWNRKLRNALISGVPIGAEELGVCCQAITGMRDSQEELLRTGVAAIVPMEAVHIGSQTVINASFAGCDWFFLPLRTNRYKLPELVKDFLSESWKGPKQMPVRRVDFKASHLVHRMSEAVEDWGIDLTSATAQ